MTTAIRLYRSSRLSQQINKGRYAITMTKLALVTAVVTMAGVMFVAPTAAQAAAPLKWAVSSGTTLVRGSGTTGFTHLGPGQYEVTFNSSVNGCAYVASTQVSATQALTVFTAGGHLSLNGVYVETKNQGGGLSDAPFHLFVSCDATGSAERHVVVGYMNNLVRSSVGTTMVGLGAGRYNVHFTRNVRGCAYLATVGDPANSLVFSPSGVYTSADPADVNGVYIETKNPGGGLQSGVPFHLAVVCPVSNFRLVVVNATGTPQRASSLTSAFSSSVGQYTAATDRDVSQCAWIATRGETGIAVPFTPTTVEVTRGPAKNTVNVQQRNLLFFGGAFINQAFHLVAAC